MTAVKSNTTFELGQVVITRGALEELPPFDVWVAINRHANGDWGDLCEEDTALNDASVKGEGRLMSRYQTDNGTAFWIITEWDRSVTTILLPLEY